MAEILILKVLYLIKSLSKTITDFFLNLSLSSVEGLCPLAPEEQFRNGDPVSNTLSIIYNQLGQFINL